MELLVGHLDAQQVVERALDRLGAVQHLIINYGHNGRDDGFFAVVPDDSEGGSAYIPASDYVLAHAVWLLDRHLDKHASPYDDNIVERRIVPAILRLRRWHSLPFSVPLGGSVVQDFLLRQDWRTEPSDLEYGDVESLSGAKVNRWLYWLCQLREPEARRWQHRHQHLLMDIADEVGGSDVLGLSFMFDDHLEGFLSLAEAYWPRFKRAVAGSRGRDLRAMGEYLVKMGSAASEQMYIEAMHEQRDDPFWHAFDHTDLLPAEKQIAVWNAMRREVMDNSERLAALLDDRDAASFRRQALRVIEGNLMLAGDPQAIERRVADIVADPGRQRHGWLVEDHADHPLVARLAVDESPAVRLLVIDALREHPSPRNRALVAKLREDPDEAVRAAAHQALAATPPAELAAP